MLIAPAGYKVDGKLNGEGMVFVVCNPTFDKASGMFTCSLTSYANIDDYVAGEVYRQRHYEIRLNKKDVEVAPGPRGMDFTERLNYYCPDVVRGWGRTSAKATRTSEETWPSNVYAQAYVLIALLPEFEGFISDEQTTQAAIETAVSATKPTKRQSA